MYCVNCGAEITDDSNFCFKCGAKVNIPLASIELLQEPLHTEEANDTSGEIQEDEESGQFHAIWKVILVIGIFCVIYYLYSDSPGKSSRRNIHDRENRQTYANIGDEISVKHFIYRVNGVKFTKSLRNEILTKRADGIYLIIGLSIFNRDKVPHTIDNSMFRLTDENGLQYESSGDATTALLMNGEETLFLTRCNPQIQKQGLLAFEVPRKGIYNLQLSGGSWTGETAVVRLASR
jgi:hypothetical protein